MSLLFLAPLFFLTLAAAYLAASAVASLRNDRPGTLCDPSRKFAVVVPAHDEEATIGTTLRSLRNIDYPKELFEVVVIADNCTDGTADAVRSMGVRCLERFDPERRGKGQALRHAFDILLAEDFEAVAVIDADTVVQGNFLSVMNARLQKGELVLQARYGATNPDESPLAYMLAVGNCVENDLFLKGRERLGLPGILRGNGMCFDAGLLRDHPWDASSVVEDTEYSLELLRKGIQTRIITRTEVLAPLPRDLEQAAGQRVRWASGNSRLTRLSGFKLMAEGFRTRQWPLVDMGWCLFVRSKPLLLFMALSMLVLCSFFDVLAVWAFWLAVFYISYLFWGVIALGLNYSRFLLALRAPLYLAWLIGISILGLTGFRAGEWIRTKRS